MVLYFIYGVKYDMTDGLQHDNIYIFLQHVFANEEVAKYGSILAAGLRSSK